MTSLWPQRTPRAMIRLLILLLLLALTIKAAADLYRFDPGSVFVRAVIRLIGTGLIESSANLPKTSVQTALGDDYQLSLLDQIKIAAACDSFFAFGVPFPRLSTS